MVGVWYANDICELAESKTELAATLNVFNDVLTEYGMTLSAEKSFWMTLGCSVDESDRQAIQLPCGPVKYTKSFKYLGVEITTDLTDTADIDAKLSRGRRGIFTSLSKVFHSTALPVKLRVKLFQTLIVPTVLHAAASAGHYLALCVTS